MGSSRVEPLAITNLYEAWKIEKVELAIPGELLMRGPQTGRRKQARLSQSYGTPSLIDALGVNFSCHYAIGSSLSI